jgi:hypothetical protein
MTTECIAGRELPDRALGRFELGTAWSARLAFYAPVTHIWAEQRLIGFTIHRTIDVLDLHDTCWRPTFAATRRTIVRMLYRHADSYMDAAIIYTLQGNRRSPKPPPRSRTRSTCP